MPLKEDLTSKISAYANGKYVIEETTIVPAADNPKLTFGNNGLLGEFAFLFADIRKSSKLIETYGAELSAKIFQSYHDICVRVIIANSGEVRSFDGDRVMGVFPGNFKNNNAVKAGQQILYGVREILNSLLGTNVKCGVGIDNGQALVTKVGKGANTNNNDIIFIGQATNYAAHLCNEASNCVIISRSTYSYLKQTRLNLGINGSGENIWKSITLPLKTGDPISCHSSVIGWPLDL